MPVWVSLYVGIMLVSIPMGVVLLRRIEQDWLHPVGGLISTLLSIAFVISYWLPEAIPFQSNSTVLLYGFVLFWDLYALLRLRKKLPEIFDLPEDENQSGSMNSWWLGLLLMIPAYYFGALVCLRVISSYG